MEDQQSSYHHQTVPPNVCNPSSSQSTSKIYMTDCSASSPLHSLANVALAAAANGSSNVTRTPIVANVWIPPRVEHHVAENHDKRMALQRQVVTT
uniref:Uncharacterized protein n=1 Tax=Ditylenchus dipsaci TaxID=166011 RepID=A0A915CSE7_9BILA